MLHYFTPNNRLGRTLGVSLNFVTERIAVGGEILSKADVDQIVAAGITHVIDMRAEFDTLNVAGQHQSVSTSPQLPNSRARQRNV
jgi:hypothetical protein